MVKTKFDGHIVVRRNAIFERSKFSRRSQEEGESVDILYHLAVLLSRTLRIWHSERRNDSKSHCRRDHRHIAIIDIANGWCFDSKKNYQHGSTNRGRQEQTFLRSKLATGGSSNVDVMQDQGQGARKPNKHNQSKTKTWPKVQNSKQVASRKCDRCGK